MTSYRTLTSYRTYRTFRTLKNLQYIFHLFLKLSFFLGLVKVLVISLKNKKTNLILLIFSFFVLVSIPTILHHFLPLANLELSSLSNSLRSQIRLSIFLYFSVGIYCSAIFLVLLLLHLIRFYYAIFSMSVSRSFHSLFNPKVQNVLSFHMLIYFAVLLLISNEMSLWLQKILGLFCLFKVIVDFIM